MPGDETPDLGEVIVTPSGVYDPPPDFGKDANAGGSAGPGEDESVEGLG